MRICCGISICVVKKRYWYVGINVLLVLGLLMSLMLGLVVVEVVMDDCVGCLGLVGLVCWDCKIGGNIWIFLYFIVSFVVSLILFLKLIISWVIVWKRDYIYVFVRLLFFVVVVFVLYMIWVCLFFVCIKLVREGSLLVIIEGLVEVFEGDLSDVDIGENGVI